MRRELRRTAALVLAAALAVVVGGCSSDDDWSRPHGTPSAVGALRPGFVDPDASPAPMGTISPSPGTWDDVRPPEGYRVVLLAAGDDSGTSKLATAVTRWADAEDVSLKTVSVDGPEQAVDGPEQAVDGIVEAMELGPDLIVCAGNDLIDALAVVSANHLDRQFLVLGAQLPEPTANVTATIWPGAASRGSEVPGADPSLSADAVTPDRADAAIRAGAASVLSGWTGFVIQLD